ncbi:MAG TPA: alpha/beta hydrolase [Mycobacteriales bacterium]|nr:alpha/beta hydrolase [Mycobacteriales bacterium]
MSWPDPSRLRWSPTVRVPSDDGTEIAVEILGDTHPGSTLVFTHGWTFSSRSWHYQRMLAERWRLVLMDHRDHGESGRGPREHRTVGQVGRDLYAVLQATCAGRDVVLVGHSMGGMTIMALAAEHPELFGAQVKGVALLSTSAKQPEEHTFGLRGPLAKGFVKQWQGSLALMTSDPVRAERARRNGSVLSVAVSRFLNLGKRPDWRLARFTEAMSAAVPAEVVGDFWVSLDAHDKTQALATMAAVPTLVLVGDHDRLTPVEGARQIAARIPGSRLVELRDAGHCAMLEQPDAVNAALRELVEAATATTRATPAAAAASKPVAATKATAKKAPAKKPTKRAPASDAPRPAARRAKAIGSPADEVAS